jgi:hypothetical protein
MAVVKELLKEDKNGSLSFGDYTLGVKAKKSDFPFDGNLYKIKTFNEITKLEKNDNFLYESVPGTAVFEFKEDENGVSFTVTGESDAEITLGLLPETEYDVRIEGKDDGVMKTNLGGKITISVELENNSGIAVEITKR